jgi:hypothetical protein
MLATPGQSAGGANYVGNWSIGTSNTTAAAPVTIDGSDVSGATLDGNDGSSSGCSTGSCDGPVLTVSARMFLAIKDVTVQNANNSSSGDGGGPQNDAGATVAITGSTFTDNTAAGADDDGGVIDNADHGGSGTVTISDSTFSGDNAVDGGEIDTSDNGGNGVLVLSASTLEAGGGPDVTAGRNGGSGQVFVAGDVFAGGCQQNGGTWDEEGYDVAADSTCVTNGENGDVDAGSVAALKLGLLADNGGPTQTIALGGAARRSGSSRPRPR